MNSYLSIKVKLKAYPKFLKLEINEGEKNFPLTIILFAMFTLVCLSEDGVQPKHIA